jgi:PAS domain S-box-containing protein
MALQLFEANQTTKQRENELRTERDKFRTLADTSPVPIVTVSGDGSLAYANREAKETLGIEDSEGTFRSYDDPRWEITQFNGEPFPQDQLPFSIVQRTHEPVHDIRHAVTLPGGEKRYLSINAAPLFDAGGTFDGIVAVTLDMTERVRSEQRLRESEYRHRDLFERAPVGIFQTDSSGNVLSVNPTMAHMVGADSPQEAIDQYNDLGHQLYLYPERRREFIAVLQEHSHVRDFEYQARILDGSIRTFTMNARKHSVSSDGSFVIDGFATDTTERRTTEAALRQREELYRMLADNMMDVVYRHDIDEGLFSYVSPSVERVLGYKPKETLSMTLGDVLPTESYEHVQDAIRRKLTSGEPYGSLLELDVLHKDGHLVPMELHASFVPTTDGEPVEVVGVARDVTQRKRLERELKQEHALLRDVVDNVPDYLFVKDRESRFVTTSANHLRILGLNTVDEAIGKTDFDFFPPHLAEKYYNDEQRVIATGTSLIDEEEQTVDENGNTRWLRTTKLPFIGDDGSIRGIIGISHDVTGYHRKREELEHTVEEKQYLLRELNHRVKNNLRMVSSLVELKDSALGDGVDLSDIRHQVEAIEKVHASLQESDRITHIRLRRYVEDILSAVFRSFTNERITLENQIPDISVKTKTAVPLGLIINETATNAIKHGFTGQSGDQDPRFSVAMEKDPNAEHYVVTISNTGRPLPEQVDIENPQTLGLQLVGALVSQLQGQLEVERTPHPTFTIRLPVEQL